jgi:hypothetical protein
MRRSNYGLPQYDLEMLEGKALVFKNEGRATQSVRFQFV